MDARERKLLDVIFDRWHRETAEFGLTQAIFDIGVLSGIIASQEVEIQRLRDEGLARRA